MAPGLPQEELERIRRRLDGRGQRGDGLGVGRLLDDLDTALVQLAQEGVLLELGELVRLGDLGEVGGANRAGLLGLLEQVADVLEAEDVARCRSGSRGRGTRWMG